MLSFNPSTVKTNTVGKFCTMMGRSQRTALAEWAMVNPAKILDFFNRMNKDTGFRIFYGGMYEGMKLIYRRMLDSDLPVNVKLEEHLLGKLDKKLEEERRALDRCETEVRARKKRVEWMEAIRFEGELKDRSRWKEGIPSLPSWKQKKPKKTGENPT